MILMIKTVSIIVNMIGCVAVTLDILIYIQIIFWNGNIESELSIFIDFLQMRVRMII